MLPVAMVYPRWRCLIIHDITYFNNPRSLFGPHFRNSQSATKSCMSDKLYGYSTKMLTLYPIIQKQEQHTTDLAVLDKLSSTIQLIKNVFLFGRKSEKM